MKPLTVRDTAVQMKQIRVMIAGIIIPLVFQISASGIKAAGPGVGRPAAPAPPADEVRAILFFVSTVATTGVEPQEPAQGIRFVCT